MGPSDLDVLIRTKSAAGQPVTTEDLTPFVTELLVKDHGIPSEVLTPPKPAPAGLLGGVLGFIVGRTFSSPEWKAHRLLWGCPWAAPGGHFEGEVSLKWRGEQDYVYRPNPANPLRFTRPNGEVIEPGVMATDGGSVPRLVWSIPGLNPWSMLPAYLVHDWICISHHTTSSCVWSFEDCNTILGEGIYTMMTNPQPDFSTPEDWRVAAAIVLAVSSYIGRRLWASQWTPAQQAAARNP